MRGLTHPDIWILWVTVFLTLFNSIDIVITQGKSIWKWLDKRLSKAEELPPWAVHDCKARGCLISSLKTGLEDKTDGE